jgi:hypothetical protein
MTRIAPLWGDRLGMQLARFQPAQGLGPFWVGVPSETCGFTTLAAPAPAIHR